MPTDATWVGVLARVSHRLPLRQRGSVPVHSSALWRGNAGGFLARAGLGNNMPPLAALPARRRAGFPAMSGGGWHGYLLRGGCSWRRRDTGLFSEPGGVGRAGAVIAG